MAYIEAQQQLFQVLGTANWKAMCAKLYLGYMHIEVLGHVVSEGKVYPMDAKVQAVTWLLVPKNVKELTAFLGRVGFY